MLKITEHAIKRYIERIEKCSFVEAENKIRNVYLFGRLLKKKANQKAICKDNIVLIIEIEGYFETVKTVEKKDFYGWWKY